MPSVVAHLISDLDLGGAEVAVVDLVTRLDRTRFSPVVICLRRGGPLEARLAAAGVPVHLVRFASRTSLTGLFRLSRFLRDAGARIVHTHLRRSGTAGRLAALLAGVPVLIHHEHSLEREPNARQRWIYRFLARRTRAILCVSRQVLEVRSAWTGAEPARFRVLSNFIDGRFRPDPAARAATRAALGVPDGAPLLGTVGRLAPIKNQRLFLQACARFAAGRPEARFLVVGEGRCRAELEAAAREGGIAERTIFAGARPDPEALYPAMDLFALTSDSEGFGLAIVEAQACGAPVVTTDAGAARELVADGAGLLVEERTPAALADAFARVLGDSVLATALRERGTMAAKRFDARRTVGELEALYAAALA